MTTRRDIPPKRKDGLCSDCKHNMAVTREGFCKKCLHKRIVELPENAGSTMRSSRSADKMQARDTTDENPWGSNAVRAMEDGR